MFKLFRSPVVVPLQGTNLEFSEHVAKVYRGLKVEIEKSSSAVESVAILSTNFNVNRMIAKHLKGGAELLRWHNIRHSEETLDAFDRILTVLVGRVASTDTEYFRMIRQFAVGVLIYYPDAHINDVVSVYLKYPRLIIFKLEELHPDNWENINEFRSSDYSILDRP